MWNRARELKPSYLAARMPSIIAHLMDKYGWSISEATTQFYSSQVGKDVIDPDVLTDTFSTPLIVELFDEELQTGSYDFPEVV